MRVVVDSGSNLREIKGIDGCVVPLRIVLGDDKEYVDNADLDVEGMVTDLENSNKPSHSACPNIQEWMDAFGDDEEVIGIALAAALSGSYNAGATAAAQYMEEHPGRKVFVLDTCNIGPVEKLVIDKIVELKDQGKSYDEIVEAIKDYCKNRLKIGFCLASMNNLANNGRINPAVAKIANVLGVKVVGDFSETGILQPGDKCRGYKKAIQTMVNNLKEAGFHGEKLYIDYVIDDTNALKFKEEVLKLFPDADIKLAPTTALCSFYAERGGLVWGYERN
jgi:DegV family protein with EDD domain